MKAAIITLFLVSAILVSVCSANSRLGVEPKRLYEYIDINNRTVREWLTLQQILDKVAECGKLDQNRVQVHGGFFDVTDYQDLKFPPLMPTEPYPTELKYKYRVAAWADQINMDNVMDTITHLSGLYNRYYTTDTGLQAAHFIRDRFQSYITSSGNSRASVRLFPHSFSQPSVIATIAGRSTEVVVIGAHEDSIRSGSTPTLEAPGADDDASGTATVLECFRVVVNDIGYVPAYTLEFHTYAAEEVGLRGSQDIANNYRAANKLIRGMMQLDMTGYKNGDPAIMTDWVNTPLTNLLFNIARTYVSEAKWVETQCGYACSDHASFTRANYAAVLPAEAIMSRTNGNIHTIRDTLSLLNKEHMKLFVKLGLGWIAELAQSTTE